MQKFVDWLDNFFHDDEETQNDKAKPTYTSTLV